MRLCAALLAASAAGGCSIAVPMGSPSALWRGSTERAPGEDVTGSIAKPPEKLSQALDAEDWRRASAAMNTALDPQGSGAGVNWDNPQTGARGSITPVGSAFPLDGKICRTFRADLAAKEAHESLEGAACREKTAEWSLTRVRPRKKG
jgi:surface antigen